MELGLSLGDAPKSFGFLRENNSPNQQQIPSKKSGLDFRLGLCSKNEERGKAQKSQENDEGNDGDDEDADDGSDDNQETDTPLQLNLLPLAPVPRQISSHLWSSDNGSSENGSSVNVGHPAANGLDVNRTPAAEEVSSANSIGSPLQMEFNMYGKKREFAAAGNENAATEKTSSRSDDDENGLNGRKKLRLSKEQSAFLEESFKEHNTLNPKQKLALARQLNLRPRQVEVWFQNRRARTKLKQTEVDCEYLKRCCDTLTEENRRLHKELQELRALKSSNPFHMQLDLPPTTLTMCPSCERVSTTAEPIPNPNPNPIPFPLTRPTFYPFSNSNHPAGS